MLLAGLAYAPPAYTQAAVDDSEQSIEVLLDETGAAEEDVARLVEDLSLRVLRPLNVNTATVDKLAGIPGLSPATALNVVLYRNANGPFASYDSLRAVNGITADVWRTARPFFTVEPAAPSAGRRKMNLEAVQRVGRRSTSVSENQPHYAGAPQRMYARVSAHGGRRLSANVTMEKDPGEAFRWNPATRTYGYDFLSANLALRDLGRIRTLVIGDFTADFGQGLVLSTGSAFEKGGDPLRSAVRSGAGLRPYRSSNEFHFFRGAGLTVALSPALSATLLGSHRRLDGTLEIGCGTDPNIGCITRLISDGLHRSDLELARKGTQETTVVGGAIEYRRNRFKAGATGYRNWYDMPLASGKEPYDRFAFSGRRASAVGTYAQVYAHDLLFFGEAAYSPEGTPGGLAGVHVLASERVQAVVLLRHYPPTFTSLYGAGFAERSGSNRNETGFYTGLRLVPHRHWTLEGYFDQYRFPWIRFGVPRPTTGYETFARLEYRPVRRFQVSLQGRSETVERGAEILDSSGRLLRSVVPESRWSARAQVEYSFSQAVRIRTRIEQSHFQSHEGNERGLLAYQDVRWQPSRRLRLDTRLTLFDTDGYASRIYAFENDLLYTFALPAHSGKGHRYYALARFELFPGLMLQLKYGRTAATRGESDEPTPYRVRDVNVLLRFSL